MKRTRFLTLLFVLAAAVCAQAQNRPPLKLVATIPLPGLHEGDFDHFTADLQGHRLFLDAEENGKVEIIDAKTNTLIYTMTGFKAPHSIVYRPDLNKLFVVDGDASEIKIYNATTYQRIGQIPLRIDADSMAYDPQTHDMYVVNAGRAAHTPYSFISIVNTDTARKTGDIKVDSNRIESLALDLPRHRLYANITGENAVGVIDLDTNKLIATWPLPAGDTVNVAMAFDLAHHRLFTVTRQPAKLIVFDTDTGKVVAALPCVGFVDDAAFNPADGRIYLPGNDFVDVFQEKSPNHYVLLGKVPGSFRAKTAILVPQWHRYYLAVPRHGSQIAEVRVFEVVP